VDTTWAKQQLTHFLQLTQLSYPPPSPGVLDLSGRKVTASSSDEIIPAAQVVEQILDRALGDWRSAKPEWMSNRWQHHREAAQRALAQLQREDEIRERLGDAAPQLDAGRLHPWVWQGARSLWQSRHYGEAVRAAAIKVNAETQNKLGRRDVAETVLFREAFSPEPPQPGRPRLRLTQDDGSQSFRSLHRGVMAFAEGCYAAFRNPGSHDPQDDLTEDEALEQLAAFSVLARWIDQAAIVR
jgi:uncharacterized protein (TIGR02391 family)